MAGNEKELLEYISAYREPVVISGIEKMFTDNTPKRVIQKLLDKSLLETDHKGNYWLHPLIQEFSYKDLKNKKEAHMLAVEYYLSRPLPETLSRKEDVELLLEAHYHNCMAEEYDQAFDIIFDNKLHDLLDIWGNYNLLIDLYSKLLLEVHLGNGVLLEDKEKQGAILGNIGNAYNDLGEPRKAIEYYERALKIAQDIGDRRNEGNWLGNLGIAYKNLGEPRKEINYYEQALVIFREIGDRRGEGLCLGNLGLANSALGETRKAIEYHEEALKISREIGDKRGEGNHLGNLGTAYKDLGEPRKAIEYYEQALKIAKEIGDRQNEGNQLGNLGLVYKNLDESRKAIEFLRESLTIGKAIENPRIINLCERKLKELEEIDDYERLDRAKS